MIREIKYPYKELSNLEIERIDLFRGYHFVGYNSIHVYYVTDFSIGSGYDIIVSLYEFKNATEINFNDNTKNITDVDKELETF